MALSRAQEDGPDQTHTYLVPWSEKVTRMMAVSRWAGPPGWVPQYSFPKLQEAPSRAPKGRPETVYAYLVPWMEKGTRTLAASGWPGLPGKGSPVLMMLHS